METYYIYTKLKAGRVEIISDKTGEIRATAAMLGNWQERVWNYVKKHNLKITAAPNDIAGLSNLIERGSHGSKV